MKATRGRTLATCWFAILAAVGVLCALPAAAAPPSPDLLREIAEGRKPFPEYLRQRKEKGAPKLRSGRSVRKVLREQAARRPEGGVLWSLPAPGDSVFGATGATGQAAAPPVTGDVNVLTLLVGFSDVTPWAAPASFDALVYGATAPSLSHYYREVSGNNFRIGSGVLPSSLGWLPLGGTKAGYNADLRAMLSDAVAAADGAVNFSDFDADHDGKVDYLILVHVGTGAEWAGEGSGDIWSQTLTVDPVATADGVSVDTFMTVPEYWAKPGDLPSPMTIGVYAHEFGHLLGLPDLYDYGLDSRGIGDWGLMGHGMWNGTGGQGGSPSWISAWGRVVLGWVAPVTPSVDQLDVILPPVEQGGPVYYLWNRGLTNTEFFLIENRQKIGTYDGSLPGAGLLVWHIDENMPDNSSQIPYTDAHKHDDCYWPSHYLVALQQADGYMNLEQPFFDPLGRPQSNGGDPADPYPGTYNITAFLPTSTLDSFGRTPPNSGSYANCGSRVAIRRIAKTGAGNLDIHADLEVVGINDPPVAFDSLWNVDEDTPAQFTLSARDGDGDPLTYLVVGGPAHGALSGTPPNLTYTPDADYNGPDGFTFHVNDGIVDSNIATVTITVTPVNDAPRFVKGADQTILEDAGAQTVPLWATAISAGPPDEAGQALTFVVTNDNNALFDVQPSVAANGTLTYTPAANASGSATIMVTLRDSGGTAGGGIDTSAPQTFAIAVTPVNDAPSFAKGPDQTIFEDAGAQTVPVWATAISAGPPDEAAQTLTFMVTNDNNALFSVQPAVVSNGTLTYTPAANANGSATITVTLRDSGGVANGGADTSLPQTFTIAVTPVNDAPVLSPVGDKIVAEGGLLTFMLPGSDPDSGVLTYTGIGLPTGAIVNETTGEFAWTPVFDQAGDYLVTFRVSDGVLYAEEMVTIRVTDTNRPPRIAPPGDVGVVEGDPVSFIVQATDPDGDQVSLGADALPPGATFDPGTGAFTWTPGFSSAGPWVVTFGAIDAGTPPLVSSESVVITVANPSGPVFSDAFSNVVLSRQNWAAVSGTWAFSATQGALIASSRTATNLARIVKLDPATLPLGAGVIQGTMTLTAQAGTGGPNGMIVFAYQSPLKYRWVKVTPASVQIGQTGSFDGIGGGPKKRAPAAQALGRPVKFTVKVRPTGLVQVFRGSATVPLLAYRFLSVVPGGVGLGSVKARTVFDNVRVWEDSALVQ